MIVLSLFVEFDKIDATKSSFCRFLSKLTKPLLYGSTWQKVGAVFVTFCRILSIFVTNFPSASIRTIVKVSFHLLKNKIQTSEKELYESITLRESKIQLFSGSCSLPPPGLENSQYT